MSRGRPTLASVRATYDHYFELMRGESWFIFMNHGYSPLSFQQAVRLPALAPEDQPWRHQVYLYLTLAAEALAASGKASLAGARLLDVGCGRGGGLSVLSRHHTLARAVGLDLNRQQIEFCRRRHAGIEFIEGNALALPFADRSFELLFNVESFHCYPNPRQFFQEARRVLAPGGLLVLADTRVPRSRPAALEAVIRRAELTLVASRDISANVRRACALDVARFEHPLPRAVASDNLRKYDAGQLSYRFWVLRRSSRDSGGSSARAR